jgi:hypothetical protein
MRKKSDFLRSSAWEMGKSWRLFHAQSTNSGWKMDRKKPEETDRETAMVVFAWFHRCTVVSMSKKCGIDAFVFHLWNQESSLEPTASSSTNDICLSYPIDV